MENHCERKRIRDDSENSVHDSPESKKLKEDLFDFLDETDTACPSSQDLDSVLRSLEEEILVASHSPATKNPAPIVDLTSYSGDSLPDLGYLLEASDDELGLPPSINSGTELQQEETELVRVLSESSGIGEFWGFEAQFPNYDSFDLETAENSEFVAYDNGLFAHSDVYFDSSDFSDFSWHSETLPAQ